MKKIPLLTASVVCVLFLITSCHETYTRDETLAGSISFNGYHMRADILFESDPPKDNINGIIDITKITNNKISIRCNSIGDLTLFDIFIPEVRVMGKTHDAHFEHISRNTEIMFQGKQYLPDSTYIEGRIIEKSNIGETRLSPNWPLYECNIIVGCLIDDKELIINIHEIYP